MAGSLWNSNLNKIWIMKSGMNWETWAPSQYEDHIFIQPWHYLYMLNRPLTHWGRVTHICVGKLTIIGSDNGLSPGRCQAIIWTNAGILLIRPLGTNFSEILIKITTFSFKKKHSKVLSGKRRPSCLCLNVLTSTKKVSDHLCQLSVKGWEKR